LTRNINLVQYADNNPQYANEHLCKLIEKQNFNLTKLEKSNVLLIKKLENNDIDNLSGLLVEREKIEKQISKLDHQIKNYINKKIKKNTGILNNNSLTLIKLMQQKSIDINKSFQIIIEMTNKLQSAVEQNLQWLRRGSKMIETYTSFNNNKTHYELDG